MSDPTQALPEYLMEREFKAPRELVWRCWTDPELLARWMAPNAKCETLVHQHALEPGGVNHHEMRFGPGQSYFRRWEFETIEPPERLSWRSMSSDADAGVVRSPQNPDFPLISLTTIVLEDRGDTTLLRLTTSPVDAEPHELEAFREAMRFMGQGWGGGFDNLEGLLAELAA